MIRFKSDLFLFISEVYKDRFMSARGSEISLGQRRVQRQFILSLFSAFYRLTTYMYSRLTHVCAFSRYLFQAFNIEETLAISSQVMNRNNVRIVIEEIIKVGNLPRSSLPPNIDTLSPSEQVGLYLVSTFRCNAIRYRMLFDIECQIQ